MKNVINLHRPRPNGFTAWEYDTVVTFLKELEKLDEVEAECGTPVKVTVNWSTREVEVKGPLSGRILKIKDILEAAK